MKKNISINFFGTIYAIDEDAYRLLEDYIANMKLYFSHEEGGEEIADDIEHRVAELLWEYKEQGMSAVDIDTVKEIIEKIGNPADIDDEGSSKHTTTATDNASDTPDEEEENRKREQEDEKKSEQNGLNTLVDKINDLFAKLRQNMEGRHLYRDTKNKMLGGVCAGLAEYFNLCDVVFWRLGFILLVLCIPIDFDHKFSLSIPVLYLLLWLVLPEAKTPEDRLRMKGVKVTPENLAEQIIRDSSDSQKPSKASARTPFLSGCLSVLFFLAIGCLMIPLFGFFFLALIFTICLFLFTFELFDTSVLFSPTKLTQFNDALEAIGALPWLAGISGILIFGILIYSAIRVLRRQSEPMAKSTKTTLLFTWFIALAFFIVSFTLICIRMNALDDIRRTELSTRNNITLNDPRQWARVDNLGWSVKELKNIRNYIIEERGGLGDMPNYAFILRRMDFNLSVSFLLTKETTLEEGKYILESILAEEGEGAVITATVDSLCLTTLNPNEGEAIKTLNLDEARQYPILQQVDSLGWSRLQKEDRAWKHVTSKPFHHKGGPITLNILANECFINRLAIRHIKILKVE